MKIRLTNEKLRYIALFEELTGVTPRDCIECDRDKRLTFVVDGEDMGRAIGEKGRNIRKVRRRLDRNVDIVEFSDDPEEFLENILSPVEIREAKFEEEGDKKAAHIKVRESEKGRAVGRNGWNIKRARKLLSRHHGVSDVSLT